MNIQLQNFSPNIDIYFCTLCEIIGSPFIFPIRPLEVLPIDTFIVISCLKLGQFRFHNSQILWQPKQPFYSFKSFSYFVGLD